jgi:hypothetical protein
MTITHDEPNTHARHRIAAAAGAALLVGGLLLVMFVLPAEYGVDPLGVGAKTGLLDLGITGQQVKALTTAASTATAGAAPIIVPQEKKFAQETVDFTLAPGEGMEYKYRLDKGESLLYAWSATAPVEYELHAEPDGAPRGYAQSYEKAGPAAGKSGTLTAPFPGIHGWYWHNGTNSEVTVSLSAAGFYNLSHEFRTGAPVKNKSF